MASNKEKVIDILSDLANDKQFGNIKIGLFGSYARNEQTNNSDIDVVLKSTKPLLLVYDGIEDTLQTYIKANLGLECDVVDYADLEAGYEEAKKLGIEEFTLKPVIDKEAIWIGK
ncbi:MAG: polymerase beta, Nucleotidyltransferase [Herbinix sp.]|jgi:predicted nucleotidyltransferase|nr:polymerase beta, Nucleotidyltransferase [Herbinix sp.]